MEEKIDRIDKNVTKLIGLHIVAVIIISIAAIVLSFSKK